MKKIISIVGPTATGKTALSIALAKKYNGEIICMDSMQIYKEMDVGTAKPTKEETAEVKHHLFDFVSPFTPFSCKDYVENAKKVVDDILERGKTPVFCGGTGLYIDRLVSGSTFEETEIEDSYRKELQEYAEQNGNTALHKLLEEVDPESALAIHENNVKRVIRALEIYKTSGKKKSDVDRESKEVITDYDLLQIGLKYDDREELYRRIEKRVDIMLKKGLLDETKRLKEMGVFVKNSTSAQAIGYKELLSYLNGEGTLEDAVQNLKTATRKYAKRQLTWFNAHGNTNWISKDGKTDEEILAEASKLIDDFQKKKD